MVSRRRVCCFEMLSKHIFVDIKWKRLRLSLEIFHIHRKCSENVREKINKLRKIFGNLRKIDDSLWIRNCFEESKFEAMQYLFKC